MIPEDWEIKSLHTMLRANPKYGINAPAVKLEGDLPVYIRITDISDEGYFAPSEKVGVDNKFSDSYYLEDGDLVFTRTGASVGKSYLYNPTDGKLVYAGFLIKISPNKEKLFPSYLAQFVKTSVYWNWVRVMSMRSGQPGINGNEYGQLLIPLPPTRTEQTAIANALSDADALIQSLTSLIAKKRQIKQGAMQTLLNPYENGRLKAGWHESPLREVSYMKGRIGWQGLKQTEFTMNEEEPFLITGMNFKDGEIRWNEVYHISHERYEIAKDIQLMPNDVLMTKDGTIGKLLYVNDIPYPGKASLNSHLLVFRPMRNSYDPRFLYYQLSSKVFRDYIEISKSGSTFFGLSQEAVGNYLFKFPKLEEQTRIATILSGMDAEIAALETKLAKYRHIKQGMMQNLLTGRIRLI